MLEIRNLKCAYTQNNFIIKGLNLTINNNEVVGIIGQNGSGKSTLAKSILHLVPYVSGEIDFNGKSIINKKTNEISNMGIGFFLQGGRIFPNLTIQENMDFVCGNINKQERLDRLLKISIIFDLFKRGRMNLKASYLSGGEQHQLALAMLLIQEPRLLILDEPSAGLSPEKIKKTYKILDTIKKRMDVSILLIEQNADLDKISSATGATTGCGSCDYEIITLINKHSPSEEKP